MVLSSASILSYSHQQEYKSKPLGFRDLLVLTLGTIDGAMGADKAITLIRTLMNHLSSHVFKDDITRAQFDAIVIKLQHEKVINTIYDEKNCNFKLLLTPLGLGELDGILFIHEDIFKRWKNFKYLSSLAAC